ncbi:MAG TPA: hypothetical protein VGG03_15390 [Thermoanaerobaculia bacterium]|jgi:hypothetical protein
MKRRREALALTVLLLLSWAAPAAAATCIIEETPAATLLLPYFEVDLNNPNGLTTLFSMNNASAAAVLAHVVIWSDLAVPVLGFNVYLTGYDVQTINLRDILISGALPPTASSGQDPSDNISPQGVFSQDRDFASCAGVLPPSNLPDNFIQHLQLALTGRPSPVLDNRCAGRNLGDNIARGYVTVDVVSNCTLRFPGDAGYFAAGGTGDATNQNELWGDYFYVNPGESFAQGETLVHIQADASNPELSTAGQYTFYGRYVGWSAADNRQPLSTNFAVRFLNGGLFSGGSSLVVWRDPKINQQAFVCPAILGIRPPWFPLNPEARLAVVFDEQEQPLFLQEPIIDPQPSPPTFVPFPAAAQRTRVGGTALPVPFQFGWLYLNLNDSVVVAGPNPPEDPAAAQAWVTVIMDANGRFSVGFEAIKLDRACKAKHLFPGF